MKFLLIILILILMLIANANARVNWTCETEYDPVDDTNINRCETQSIQKNNTNSYEKLHLRTKNKHLEIFLYLGINTENIKKIEVKFDKQPKGIYQVIPSADASSVFINSYVIDFAKNVMDGSHVYIRFLSDDNFLKTIEFDLSGFKSNNSTHLVSTIIELDKADNARRKEIEKFIQDSWKTVEEDMKRAEDEYKKEEEKYLELNKQSKK